MSSTIAAISTAIGEAGIGIVRCTGDESLQIIKNIFKKPGGGAFDETMPRYMQYGFIYDENGHKVDEVLSVYMKAPYTYTTEDMVEIHCHGGNLAVQQVLKTVLRQGAQLAEPGEFTKRAFLNGRLDLSQAEAVIDLIHANSQRGYEVSLGQLGGRLTAVVENLREKVTELLAFIEADIDFPEDDLERLNQPAMLKKSLELQEDINKLIKSAQAGKILKDGIKTVILGKPNVGKSSLLNQLLREERAIVTDIPGTTRDTIEAYINIQGLTLCLMDTAGIRETEDVVEKIGVTRAKELAERADLILAVFDRSEPFTEEDRAILSIIEDKKAIVLWNKSDLEKTTWPKDIEHEFKDLQTIETSLLYGEGVDILEEGIAELFFQGELISDKSVVINNIRHLRLLEQTKDSIDEVVQAVEMGIPLDCIEVDLRNAWEYLGEILGKAIGEDILDTIFSQFCIGK